LGVPIAETVCSHGFVQLSLSNDNTIPSFDESNKLIIPNPLLLPESL